MIFTVFYLLFYLFSTVFLHLLSSCLNFILILSCFCFVLASLSGCLSVVILLSEHPAFVLSIKALCKLCFKRCYIGQIKVIIIIAVSWLIQNNRFKLEVKISKHNMANYYGCSTIKTAVSTTFTSTTTTFIIASATM